MAGWTEVLASGRAADPGANQSDPSSESESTQSVQPDGVTIKKPRKDIANWKEQHTALVHLVANFPYATLAFYAAESGYTPSYLSIMFNSDSFKRELNEYQKQRGMAMTETVANDIKAKISSTAIVGLERLEKVMQAATDLDSLAKANSMLLDKLGYGPTKNLPGVVINQNNLSQTVNGTPVVSSVYELARVNMARRLEQSNVSQSSPIESEPIDGTFVPSRPETPGE